LARKFCLREATLRKDVVEHNWHPHSSTLLRNPRSRRLSRS
jgi:hypothetical protein